MLDKRFYLYYGEERDYDIDDPYGFFMLNKEFDGYYVAVFCRSPEENYNPVEMNPNMGEVYFDGEPTEFRFIKSNGSWQDWWLLGVNMRNKKMKNGETHVITVKNFTTADGINTGEQDVIFHVSGGFSEDGNPMHREHARACLNAAREGAVLLKNDGGILPLKRRKINVFGNAYTRFYNQAKGAGSFFARYTVGFEKGMAESGGFMLNPELRELFEQDELYVPTDEVLARARKFSTTALIMLGRGSSENVDNEPIKGEYYLKDEELLMIEKVSKVFEKTAVVLNTGYPIDVRFVETYNIKGVLWFSYGGMCAGQVLGEILSGKVNPSGRLPDTWALDYYDYPSSRNFIVSEGILGRPGYNDVCAENVYEEGIYVGYRYFDTFGVPCAYPIGSGISYTTFSYEVSGGDFTDKLTLDVKVTNTGKVSGKQALIAYISKPDGEIEVPAHEIVDFRKTCMLVSGESDILHFEIDKRELAVCDVKRAAYVMPKGDYVLYVGTAIDDIKEAFSFSLDEDEIISTFEHLCLPKKKIDTLSKHSADSYPSGSSSFNKAGHFDFRRDTRDNRYDIEPLPKYEGEIIYYQDVESDPSKLDDFVAQMSVEELARINVCAQAWSMEGNKAAGLAYSLDKYRMNKFVAADGNSTLRVGARTVGFPSSVMVCASFNRDVAYEVGRVIAEEAKEYGVHLLLAPGSNIHRNILCGRSAEYFSEDPVLSGIMAAYNILGYQENGVAATIKHVIANSTELVRMKSHSVIDERAFREIYVKNFELQMRLSNPQGLMTSYNACNHCYTACDSELIIGLFERELGFEGFVMSDWNSFYTVDHVLMVGAGNCWVTPGSMDDEFTKGIVEGVADGRVQIGRLQDNVKRFITVMLKYTKA